MSTKRTGKNFLHLLRHVPKPLLAVGVFSLYKQWDGHLKQKAPRPNLRLVWGKGCVPLFKRRACVHKEQPEQLEKARVQNLLRLIK